MPSRPARGRVSSGRFATESQAADATTSSRSRDTTRRHSDKAVSYVDDSEEEDGEEMFREDRPVKKRKLEVRSAGPKQRTLHSLGFFARGNDASEGAENAAARPPTKIKLTRPGGKLIETVNGTRNELDLGEGVLGLATGSVDTVSRAQSQHAEPMPNPSPVPRPVKEVKKEEKRTLRSQDDGPRLKSELAVYFPNYEDVMFDAPKEDDFMTVDSNIYIADDMARTPKAETPSPAKASKQSKASPKNPQSNGLPAPSTPQHSVPMYSNGVQEVDLSTYLRHASGDQEDPLAESHFLKAHKRAERKEKQLRNIERERAMHEKVQLDRLLDGLQGHDWLKVLGVTGVTDGEAKRYEPKRDYFIAEVQALVDKFTEWKEEERRQRLEKEAALAAEREAEEASEEISRTSASVEPPSSDLNASAARQLQQETASALKASKTTGKSKHIASSSTTSTPTIKLRPPAPPIPYRPPSPITSFYSKRHLRDAALKKTRQGRNVTAFGQPVPEMEEQEFELPEEYITENVLKASARERRRRKRESVANAAGK